MANFFSSRFVCLPCFLYPTQLNDASFFTQQLTFINTTDLFRERTAQQQRLAITQSVAEPITTHITPNNIRTLQQRSNTLHE